MSEFVGVGVAAGVTYNTNGVARLPCVNTTTPASPSFYENNYWRGRSWGLHAMLMCRGLRAHEQVGVEGLSTACASLVAGRLPPQLGNVRPRLEGHVHENHNSAGGDSSDADPFYHWGALTASIALLDAELIPNSGRKA